MLRVLPLLSLLLAAAPLGAAPLIYSCIDGSGKRLTSDRPIPECNAREQRMLNADGSVRRVIPPNLTADERAEIEAREREAEAARRAENEARRRDRTLMQRYPNEAAHRRAREQALENVRKTLRLSESRIELLAKERKPLTDETEFYAGKPLPAKLKQQLDANDAATDATQVLLANQQAEIVRINQSFDNELLRLKALWGGAPPGSLGAMVSTAAPAASAPAAKP